MPPHACTLVRMRLRASNGRDFGSSIYRLRDTEGTQQRDRTQNSGETPQMSGSYLKSQKLHVDCASVAD